MLLISYPVGWENEVLKGNFERISFVNRRIMNIFAVLRIVCLM